MSDINKSHAMFDMINKAVDRCVMEYTVEYHEIIGVLDIVKSSLISKSLREDEEGDL